MAYVVEMPILQGLQVFRVDFISLRNKDLSKR